jgi:signal transduction histidine kinase/CheY-like chemotaxis protein
MSANTSDIRIFTQRPSDGRKLAKYLEALGEEVETKTLPNQGRLRNADDGSGQSGVLQIYLLEDLEGWEASAAALKKTETSASGSPVVLASEAVCRSWATGRISEDVLFFSKPQTVEQWRRWAKRIALMAKERRRRAANRAVPERETILSPGRFALPSLVSDFHKALSLTSKRLDALVPTLDDHSPVHRQICGINTLVRYTLGITEKMRGLCEATQGKVEVFDLNGAVREAAGFMEQIAHPRQVFRFELHPEPLEMRGDRIQILRAVSSLIVNSLEAMPNGGAIHIRSGLVGADDIGELGLRSAKLGAVWVAIQDLGPGMKPAQKDRIFEPHFSTKSNSTHTGLGLTNVKSVVAEHDGTLLCETRVGRGTTFTLYFPSLPKRRRKQTRDKRSRGIVLLVDPEPLVRSTTRRLLEHGGFRVMDASSAREGLDLYFEHRHEVDLVLMDAALSDTSPGKAVGELREINPKVRVLMSSGISASAEIEREMKGGTIGFIQKPFRMRELFAKMEKILEANGSAI